MVLAGLLAGQSATAKPITTASLLAEMTDLKAVAEFPDPPYTCRQFSSYDRASRTPSDSKTWFANADHGQYLRVEERAGRKEYVMMDTAGPGAIVRIWSANPEGTLRIYLDENETPALEAPMKDLLGGDTSGIPAPIACQKSKGWTSYFPIPYARHCKMTSDQGKFYYHVNYRTYPPETKVTTFNRAELETLAAFIQETAKQLAAPRKAVPLPANRDRKLFEITVESGKSQALVQLEGGRAICEFVAKVTASDVVEALRKVVVTMRFDGEATVESPIGDFFGAAPGLNIYESLPLGVTAEGDMWCHWYMPFNKSASIELRNLGTQRVAVKGAVSSVPHAWTRRSMHFHAKWRTELDAPTRPMRDWNYLTAHGKGIFAGAAFAIGNPCMNWWGEGDEKIFVDGETFPSHFGTGTEDYYGYAWCSALPFSHAYHDQPRCDGPDNWGQAAVNRWHIMDRIPFMKSFRFDMELWHWADDKKVTMSVVAYWYAEPGATDAFRPIQASDLNLAFVEEWPFQKIAGVIEGEGMRIIEKTAEAMPLRIGQSSDGKVMWWGNGTKPGSRLVLGFPAEKAGSYRVLARFVKQDDYGVVEVSVNGRKAGGPIDLYNERRLTANETDLGVFELKEGENQIGVQIVGANEKAVKDYMLGLDYVLLKPVLSIQPATRPAHAGQDFPVRRYGAVGDGAVKDTRAIQRAIDVAAAAGGGIVRFSPGRYLSGGLFLKNGVVLRIEAGATLLGSTDVSDYTVVVPAFRSYTNSVTAAPSLIYGEGLRDVGIVGEGTIDGQGAAFPYGPGRVRPRLLNLVTCRAVRVEGITLRNSPGWVQHYLACDDLAIRGIRVFSHANYNNDMMDVDCCRDVRISDCIGDTGDDAITLKSTADRACENITITNCVVSSHCNAIKLGTESNGGFKNIVISNCVVRPSQSNQLRHGAKAGLAGIALEVVDGGTLDRVTISNITITGAKSPLFLRLGNRARPFLAGGPRPGMGSFRNVAISNVVAADVSEIGCAIAGLPGHPIENVTLSNVSITFAGGGTKDQASATVPEKPEGYPECTMFGVLPAYGFYCRHVDGLTLSNVDVRWATPDLRPALICDDVKDLQVDALRGQSSADGVPVVVLNDVRGAMLRGCVAPPACNVFLRMQGRTEAVSATGNDLSATVTPFDFAGQTGAAALHQTGNRLKD